MQLITTHQLLLALPHIEKSKRELLLNSFNRNFLKFDITTVNRVAGYLTAVYFESKSFEEIEEDLNFSISSISRKWPLLFSSYEAIKFSKNKKHLADKIYASKHGNGNYESGDGYTYRGRGYLKLRFKNEYEKFKVATGIDFVDNPDLLLLIDYSVMSSCWQWQSYMLNEESDANDIKGICRVLFGSTNSYEKEKFYHNTKIILERTGFKSKEAQ